MRKKLREGTASLHDLFQLVDSDGSGFISQEEFQVLARRLDLNLTMHRVAEIFSSAKRRVPGAESPDLNQAQFEAAMGYLEEKESLAGLEVLGLSSAQLVSVFLLLLGVLLLLFVFIFLGIKAFAFSGSFAAVVNALLPISAGVAVGKKRELEAPEADRKADQAAQEVNDILQAEE